MTQPQSSSFTAEEPVVVGAFVTWLLVQAGAYVVGHTHLITSDQWSALVTFVEPLVTAAVLAGLAALLRAKVTPAAHLPAPVVVAPKHAAAPPLITGTAAPDQTNVPVEITPPPTIPTAGATS
jgi:hypothetical protein